MCAKLRVFHTRVDNFSRKAAAQAAVIRGGFWALSGRKIRRRLKI